MSNARSLETSSSLGFQPNQLADTVRREGPEPLLHIAPLKGGITRRHDTTISASTNQITTGLQAIEKNPDPVVLPKAITFIHNRFVSLQKWEGTVLKKGDQSFFARLVDLTAPNIDEEAEFALEEVPESDVSLMEEGAIFYWDIGYLDQTNGQRLRASSLRFRRLPAWSGAELSEAENRAKRLEQLFSSD